MKPPNAKKKKSIVKKPTVKIGFLSSFTIQGFDRAITEVCDNFGVSAKTYTSEYSQIQQEILKEKSGIKKFKPDITFLLVHPSYILGDVLVNPFGLKTARARTRFIKEKLKEYLATIDSFLERTSGMLVVANLPMVTYAPLGIQEGKTEMSVKDMVFECNAGIKRHTFSNPRLFVYDLQSFFARHGEYKIVKDPFYYIGDIYVSPGYVPYLAEDLAGFIKPYASKEKKCIVLDLDNMLWGGIVGEDGFQGIELDTKSPGNAFLDFQSHLKALKDRGILLALNSKNNPDDALKVIRDHPHMVLREDDFASIQINWDDKALNMKRIAKELNLGLDALLFFDDDPVNRARVKDALPEVEVPELPKDPALYVRALKEITSFNTLQMTEEDFKRAASYAKRRKVHEFKSGFSEIGEFLKGLKMEIVIKEADSFSIPRIAQLTKKTNQFNFTTKRYTEDAIKRLARDPNYFVYSVAVKDSFEDYGITGVFIIKNAREDWYIDTFLLSCRVIGRDIEKSMLWYIADLARKKKAKKLIGGYRKTAKNSLCKDVYPDAGFKKVGHGMYALSQFSKISKIPYISVKKS